MPIQPAGSMLTTSFGAPMPRSGRVSATTNTTTSIGSPSVTSATPGGRFTTSFALTTSAATSANAASRVSTISRSVNQPSVAQPVVLCPPRA